jgi:hypothetical protein
MTPNSNAIEQFNTLTPAHQQAVIDFIAFLKTREQVVAPTTDSATTWEDEPFFGLWADRTDLKETLQPSETNALQAFQSAGLVGCLDVDPTESYQSVIYNYLDRRTTKP